MMNFIADKQTTDDLNLLGKYRNDSIYSLFNQVRTEGGEKWLDELFRHPLTDADAINARSGVFRYFAHKGLSFPFSREQCQVVENYLSMPVAGEGLAGEIRYLKTAVLRMAGLTEELDMVTKGLLTTIEVMGSFRALLSRLAEDPLNPFADRIRAALAIFGDRRLAWLEGGRPEMSLRKTIQYDGLLRHGLRRQMQELMTTLYELDVYMAVSAVGEAKGFCYVRALPAGDNMVRIEELRHPRLERAVGNPLEMDGGSNVLFLTGANMAGKSTFMKAFGIAVYLAHMGFPVAARTLTFSVRDGLFSSINVPDNLALGYSHFYAEVLRVKAVAEQVSQGRNLVVLFDELFKGTNVKDAYDATLAVTKAFARYKNCTYIISTHIIEVGEPLRAQCGSLRSVYFPTLMEGTRPVYTYRWREGITADRHGMKILEEEHVTAIIRGDAGT